MLLYNKNKVLNFDKIFNKVINFYIVKLIFVVYILKQFVPCFKFHLIKYLGKKYKLL